MRKIIAIVGASGSGKSSVIASHLEEMGFVKIVTHTSRRPREGEVEGEDYYFAEADTFSKSNKKTSFLEFESYKGNYYGTSLNEIKEKLVNFNNLYIIIESNGAKTFKKNNFVSELTTVIQVVSPLEELESRLKDRYKDENRNALQKRLEGLKGEIKPLKCADYIVENKEGKTEETKKKIGKIINNL